MELGYGRSQRRLLAVELDAVRCMALGNRAVYTDRIAVELVAERSALVLRKVRGALEEEVARVRHPGGVVGKVRDARTDVRVVDSVWTPERVCSADGQTDAPMGDARRLGLEDDGVNVQAGGVGVVWAVGDREGVLAH